MYKSATPINFNRITPVCYKNKNNIMRKIFLISLLFICSNLFAQDAIEYQTPPKEIYDLVMAKPTPGVSFDSK